MYLYWNFIFLLCLSDTFIERYFHSLVCILPRTHWLFATLVFFNDLIYFTVASKTSSFLLIFQEFIALPNILINFHQSNSSLVLQYSKMITLTDSFSTYFLQNFQMIQLIASLIVFFFAPNTSLKLYIHVLLIYHINLHFCFNYVFYFHTLVTILILKRYNWYDFDPQLQ